MNAFIKSISQILKGSAKAFQTFPATIVCAILFSVVTIIRIHLDWQEQEAYNFLFNCLHWSFALGAIFSLAAITAAQNRFNERKAFITSNLIGAAAAVITFLSLYFFGRTELTETGSRIVSVNFISASRVSTAMLVSLITFIVLAGYPKEQSDFSRSFFMTHKAFFIALLYGIVIIGGASGVAGAVRALLYKAMSNKVYMYIATLSGFLAFTIFVGYFPDFRKGATDERREIAQKQPRFIEILFEYIMIPIMLAMTAVLILWAGKTVLGGMKASFIRLSSIATAYAFYGIWLHIMVTHYQTGLAKFYRKVYPVASLFILAFEIWAIVIQLQRFGLMTAEYLFIVTCIITFSSTVLLLFIKEKAHIIIAALVCIVAIITVLPSIGIQDMPLSSQINRLENLLMREGMFEDNKIIPAKIEPEKTVREQITSSVEFIASADTNKIPLWFDKELISDQIFKEKMGFEKARPEQDQIFNPGPYMSTNLYLPPGAVDISGYKWAVQFQEGYKPGNDYVSLDGNKGRYKIYWTINSPNNVPNLKILLGDRIIVENDLNDYLGKIKEKYPPDKSMQQEASLEDMSLKIETPEITAFLVFRNVDINLDPSKDEITYWIYLDSIYIKEKP